MTKAEQHMLDILIDSSDNNKYLIAVDYAENKFRRNIDDDSVPATYRDFPTNAGNMVRIIASLKENKYIHLEASMLGYVDCVSLEPKGLYYREELKKTADEIKAQRKHDYMVAAFGMFGGALLSAPVWAFIRKAIELLAILLSPQ